MFYLGGCDISIKPMQRGNIKRLSLFIFLSGMDKDFGRMYPLSYPDTDFLLILFCVESKETFQNCVQLWGPEVFHYCPDVPIILVGVSHCYSPHFGIDQPPSNRCVSEEEGKEAAKKIGKII